MASESVASTSNAAANNDGVRKRRALANRLIKKFPHLFKKKPRASSLTGFSHWLSASPKKIEEAIRELELSGDHENLSGFKKLLSWSSEVDRETPLIPEAASRISDDNEDRRDESHFAIRNPNVNPPNAEEIATEPTISGDDLECVRFDFGDDYGNHREFAELRKEVVLHHWPLRVTRKAPRVPEYNEKDIYELSSLEEMLQEFEFEKDNLF